MTSRLAGIDACETCSVPESDNLSELLTALNPARVAGEFVFVSVEHPPVDVEIRAMVHEDEGVSCVLERSEADRQGLTYDLVLAWITLRVASSLGDVGLTHAVSGALADSGISCNIVAGFHHDHLLVPIDRASEALVILHALASGAALDPGQEGRFAEESGGQR